MLLSDIDLFEYFQLTNPSEGDSIYVTIYKICNDFLLVNEV